MFLFCSMGWGFALFNPLLQCWGKNMRLITEPTRFDSKYSKTFEKIYLWNTTVNMRNLIFVLLRSLAFNTIVLFPWELFTFLCHSVLRRRINYFGMKMWATSRFASSQTRWNTLETSRKHGNNKVQVSAWVKNRLMHAWPKCVGTDW